MVDSHDTHEWIEAYHPLLDGYDLFGLLVLSLLDIKSMRVTSGAPKWHGSSSLVRWIHPSKFYLRALWGSGVSATLLRFTKGVDGVITWLLPTVCVCVEGLRAWSVALLGRELDTAATTIPSIAVGEDICPPFGFGKLVDPLLVGNLLLAVVLAGVADCAASFSFTTRMNSQDAFGTTVFTDLVIIACTARRAACLWSSVCFWPPSAPTGLGTSEGFLSIRLGRDGALGKTCQSLQWVLHYQRLAH